MITAGYLCMIVAVIILLIVHMLIPIQMGLLGILFIVIVASSGLLFMLLWRVLRKWKIASRQLTIIEYYAGWVLIYLTIYQVVFDKLKQVNDVALRGIAGMMLDPAYIIMLLLPLLTSVNGRSDGKVASQL